jgi:hypothetical protein
MDLQEATEKLRLANEANASLVNQVEELLQLNTELQKQLEQQTKSKGQGASVTCKHADGNEYRFTQNRFKVDRKEYSAAQAAGLPDVIAKLLKMKSPVLVLIKKS